MESASAEISLGGEKDHGFRPRDNRHRSENRYDQKRLLAENLVSVSQNQRTARGFQREYLQLFRELLR
jgi:hypothetical protein